LKIEVRDAKRVSPEVVVAESRLREGADYSEADLRDAAARLTRLPFLLSAEFSLEKGSERGRYVLVVTINETRTFFYALDLRHIFTTDHRVEPDYSDRIGVAG
jgi:outer membrane protein assembly factor BamA